MAKAYRPYVPERDLLLPVSVRPWFQGDHLALVVSAWSTNWTRRRPWLSDKDEDRGYPPDLPVMLVA
jgi:hypothetical protein